MCYNKNMRTQAADLVRRITAIGDSFKWIETEADKLMSEFNELVELHGNELTDNSNYHQMDQIYHRMQELENRASINTKLYNALVNEARRYFMEHYKVELPPDIAEMF